MVRMAALTAKIVFVLLLIFAVGCSSQKSKREDLIDQLCLAAEAFNKFFKWGNFDSAAAFVDPDYAETYAKWTTEYEERFSVESYSIVSCVLEDPEATKPPLDGKVVVKYRGVVILPDARRRDYVWTQKWRCKRDTWQIQPDFAVFEH